MITNKKETNKPKEKFYFDVKIDVLLPGTITYRILAEDPEQAVELIKGKSPNNVQYKLAGKRDLKIMVYNASSNLLRFMKNLAGR